MTVRRWATTTLAMSGLGVLLALMAPGRALLDPLLASPQQLVDTRGPDVLVVVVAWGLAVLCWGWGLLGLVLTGLSAVPGVAGRIAATALLVVLPAGARRAAAVAVGLSLATGPVLLPAAAAPVPVATASALDTSTTSAEGAAGPVPDWPGASGTPAFGTTAAAAAPDGADETGPAALGPLSPVPDWPGGPETGDHVVLRGDCLWDVAGAWLTARSGGTAPSVGATAAAVTAWHQANADVIGPDPDLLLPGQVLRPPATP